MPDVQYVAFNVAQALGLLETSFGLFATTKPHACMYPGTDREFLTKESMLMRALHSVAEVFGISGLDER